MKELLLQAEPFINVLQTYYATKQFKMEYESAQELKRLYGQIFGVYNTNVACATCVVQYLENLAAWYEREIRNHQSAEQPQEPAKEAKPCKKCGKSKTK